MMTSKSPTCGTCPHMVLADVGRGECHFDPPQTFVLPGPQGMQVLGIWRPVGTTTEGCAHHPRWPDHVGRFERTLSRERESEGTAHGTTKPKPVGDDDEDLDDMRMGPGGELSNYQAQFCR